MTEQENNGILIGNFMGLEEIGPGFPSHFCINDVMYFFSDLEYHKSWSWLIPVVEKIENLNSDFTFKPQFTIKSGYSKCEASFGHNNEFSVCYNYIEYSAWSKVILKKDKFACDTKIDSVYYLCVEFIKWYNERN